MLQESDRYRAARPGLPFAGLALSFFALPAACSMLGQEKGEANGVHVRTETATAVSVLAGRAEEDEGVVHTATVPAETPGAVRPRIGLAKVSAVYAVRAERFSETLEGLRAGEVPEQELRPLLLKGWSYDAQTGLLRLPEGVDLAATRLLVVGERAEPPWWAFERLDPKSVRFVLDGKAGVLGQDYTIDEESGVVRLRKPIAGGARFHLEASTLPDAETGITTALSIGNSPGREVARALGRTPTEAGGPAATEGRPFSVWRLEDGRVLVPAVPLSPEPVGLSISPRKDSLARDFLERGEDFLFDPQRQRLVLLGGRTFDPEKDLAKVWGVPRDERTLLFPGSLHGEGEIEFYMDGRRLEEGVDFEVDDETGELRLLKRSFYAETRTGNAIAIDEPAWSVRIGSWRRGNVPLEMAKGQK